MAKAWKAATRIEYGAPDGELHVFEPGAIVTINDQKQMAQLWEAGALEETVVADSGDRSHSAGTAATEVALEAGEAAIVPAKGATSNAGTGGDASGTSTT
jgi:hypothetical protein